MTTVVCRTQELERIDAWLAAESARPQALLLEGEPGIGKTTLWRAGVERARTRSRIVLQAQPAESEKALPLAALADLLDGCAGLDRLADHERSVLEDVRRGRANPQTELLAISRATLTLVRSLAATGGVMVAVDDVQWLDRPSAHVIEYVLRRARDHPLGILLARRGDLEPALPLGLGQATAAVSVERLTVPPMDVGELDELLRSTLALALPRPRLIELLQLTRGNPFFAIEVARGLGSTATDTPLQIPSSLSSVLAARVQALEPAARKAALFASVTPQPTVRQIEAVAGLDALRAAIASSILVIDRTRLRFTHPLLAAVVYESAFPSERRTAHLRLAEATLDADERAFQLARGTADADEVVASTLEQAAASVAARGDPGRAAELSHAAERLTPATDDRSLRRRRLCSAEYLVAAGDPARARALLEAMVVETAPGPARAALLWRLADTIGDTLDEPIRLCEQALAEAGDDPSLRAEIHTALGTFTWLAGDLARSTEHIRSTSLCARAAGDEPREAIAIGELCHAEAVLGIPWDREAMERALEIEQRLGGMPATLAPSFQLAVISVYTDEHDSARPILLAELAQATERGDEPTRATALFRLTELELRAGHFGEALAYAHEAAALARQAGIEQEQYVTTMALASALAHVGRLDEARELATAAHAAATAAGDRIVATRLAGVLGLVELSENRPEQALTWLTPARCELEQMGTGELSISGVVQNEIEALVALDRLDEAEEVILLTEQRGAATRRAWHEAVAARGRALVAAGQGDTATALAALERAHAAHARLPQPFELARTWLVEGRITRRARQQGRARAALTAALDAFDQLGAGAWATLTASELTRLPGRRPAAAGLTEMERRVAALVAEGRSNKEVATALFVSVRTVESNLTRVYRKLDIRSRTELARRYHHGHDA